jgi:hypothetical protein
MNATARRTSATAREMQDWRVWAIGGGATIALGYQALQHLGWRAALAAPPLAAVGAAGAWLWMRRRPTGFAAEATRAIVAQMPDGSRPPRLVSCRRQSSAGSSTPLRRPPGRPVRPLDPPLQVATPPDSTGPEDDRGLRSFTAARQLACPRFSSPHWSWRTWGGTCAPRKRRPLMSVGWMPIQWSC